MTIRKGQRRAWGGRWSPDLLSLGIQACVFVGGRRLGKGGERRSKGVRALAFHIFASWSCLGITNRMDLSLSPAACIWPDPWQTLSLVNDAE